MACRALSPSVNDPQSALISIYYLRALLSQAGRPAPADYPEPISPSGRVRFVEIEFQGMLKRSYRPVVRDGAHAAEIVNAVMSTFLELAAQAHPGHLPAIEEEAHRTASHGLKELIFEPDRAFLRAMLSSVEQVINDRSAHEHRSNSHDDPAR